MNRAQEIERKGKGKHHVVSKVKYIYISNQIRLGFPPTTAKIDTYIYAYIQKVSCLCQAVSNTICDQEKKNP